VRFVTKPGKQLPGSCIVFLNQSSQEAQAPFLQFLFGSFYQLSSKTLPAGIRMNSQTVNPAFPPIMSR